VSLKTIINLKNTLYLPFLFCLLFSQSDQNPVEFHTSSMAVARAGEVINIKINAKMDKQWHIYSIYKSSEGPLPTEISVSGKAVGQIAPIQEPEPVYLYDPGFETDTYYHEGDTEFILPLRLKRNLSPGSYEIYLDIFYMVCNERLCYPPMTKTDTLFIAIESGEPRDEFKTFSSIKAINDNNINNNENSLLGILLLAIGGAILSWVMPCVYPMIPIIISFFGKMSEEKHVGKNTIAFIYGLGISGTFVLIGLLVGFLSWGLEDVGAQAKNANIGNFIATNPWINLFLGFLFIFFALWMFGIINVNVAGSLVNKTDKAGQSAKSAYLGAFVLGVTFAITSFSCTVPVVGTLLVVAAAGTTGGILTSLYGMIVYGIIFAAPFVALSLFPRALEKLPNSGSWMETMKIVFGFIEIAAAIKFLWVPDLEWGLGLLPRNIVLILFLLIGFILIAYLLGFFKIGLVENIQLFKVGKGRIVTIILCLFTLYPIAKSLASAPTYHYSEMPRLIDELLEALLPPPPTDDEIAIKEGWYVDDYDGALKRAKKEGKPLFIDFTGVYCANCRVMERRVFPTESVKKQFDKMILTRLYVDKKDSLSQIYAKLQFEKYKQATQPYYVLLDPKDETTLVDTGGYIPNGFSNFLEKGMNKFHSSNN
jgi:thiol:disulfide interchange protein